MYETVESLILQKAVGVKSLANALIIDLEITLVDFKDFAVRYNGGPYRFSVKSVMQILSDETIEALVTGSVNQEGSTFYFHETSGSQAEVSKSNKRNTLENAATVAVLLSMYEILCEKTTSTFPYRAEQGDTSFLLLKQEGSYYVLVYNTVCPPDSEVCRREKVEILTLDKSIKEGILTREKFDGCYLSNIPRGFWKPVVVPGFVSSVL